MSTILELQCQRDSADRISLFNIPVDNLTMEEAISAVFACIKSGQAHQVSFVNAHCVNTARRNASYLRVLQRSSLVFADGVGIMLAGRALNLPIRDNVNGTDFFPRLCSAFEGTGKRVFLLGARPGVADRVRDWMNRHYPNVIVAGCHHGYFSIEEEPPVIQKVADSAPDLLLVAFGVPHQELWIHRNLHLLKAKVAMGVGGLFDFYSGRIPRAPVWVRKLGMEWFYRMWQEPGRMWRRYVLGNPVFLTHVARQWISFRLPRRRERGETSS